MVSVWGGECQECKSQKSKVILFNDIVFPEIYGSVGEYLCCNECSKMLKVLNDPIYKTLDEQSQKIFKFVNLFPFPKSIKALKDEFRCMFAIHLSSSPSLYLVNKNVFRILKYIYENLYQDWARNDVYLLVHNVMIEMDKNKNINVSPPIAYDYIYDIITDLMRIYEAKSSWGTNLFGTRTRRDYIHPSYHKYIKFSVGNGYVSSLGSVIDRKLGGAGGQWWY